MALDIVKFAVTSVYTFLEEARVAQVTAAGLQKGPPAPNVLLAPDSPGCSNYCILVSLKQGRILLLKDQLVEFEYVAFGLIWSCIEAKRPHSQVSVGWLNSH
jgi:hypothetical protein